MHFPTVVWADISWLSLNTIEIKSIQVSGKGCTCTRHSATFQMSSCIQQTLSEDECCTGCTCMCSHEGDFMGIWWQTRVLSFSDLDFSLSLKFKKSCVSINLHVCEKCLLLKIEMFYFFNTSNVWIISNLSKGGSL